MTDTNEKKAEKKILDAAEAARELLGAAARLAQKRLPYEKNGNLKTKWLIGILIPVLFALIAVIYNSAIAFQSNRDAQQDVQINSIKSSLESINSALSDTNSRLGRIEGRIQLAWPKTINK